MLPYDKTNPSSIEAYASLLIGKTFKDVLGESKDKDYAIDNPKRNWNNPNQKGNLGNLLEERYFGYPANSEQEADFPEAGVELKLTCFDRLKKGGISAGERLVLTMISYEGPVEKDFYKSHVWEKAKMILLIYYERMKQLTYNTLYPIRYAKLFTPPEKDMPIIIADYQKIIKVIEQGKAEELSESMTLYLGACTKGNTAADSIRTQFYPPYSPAKKRAFCFKRKYMDYVLHNYMESSHSKDDSIIGDVSILKEKTFEDIINDRLKPYIGKTDKELCNIFNIKFTQNESQWSTLTYRMLGIKGNHAEEFKKADIVVKAPRILLNGKIKENISFPAFKFKDLAEQEWETSDVHEYFSEKQLFFVLWKENESGTFTLLKSQLWHMPYHDLEGICKEGWIKIRDRIRNGVSFRKMITKSGNEIIFNNLPGVADNPIIHLRPHAKKAAYKLHDGTVKGNVDRDANELPDGQFMTTQSFWLNRTYVLNQLTSDFRP